MKNQIRSTKFSLLVAMITLLLIMSCRIESPKQYYEKNPQGNAPSTPPCDPPHVEAGESKTLTDSDGDGVVSVELDGSKSTGNTATYEWSENDLVLATGPTPPKYSFPLGAHLVTLTVTNECGATAKDALYVNVVPKICDPLVARAGESQPLTDSDGDGLESVELDGSKSTGNTATYEWSENDLVLATGPTPSKHSFSLGTHLVTLTITDDCGATAKDALYVNVVPKTCDPLVAKAGESKTLTDSDGNGAESVDLDGSQSTGNITTYIWSENSSENSPPLGTGSTIPQHSFPVGTHLITLTVTNECGATAKDALYVNIVPKTCNPLVARAGESKTLTDSDGDGVESVELDGSKSTGNIATYEWSENDLVLATGPTPPKHSFSLGTHLVILTITDECGATAKDALCVNVAPKICDPLVARAGESKTLVDSDGDGVVNMDLDGSKSTGNITTYTWSENSSENSLVLGTGPTIPHRNFSVGTHLVILTITDKCGATAKDALCVNVAPSSPCPPSSFSPPRSDAGQDQSVLIAEASCVSLNGSGSCDSDPDGDTLHYLWTPVGRNIPFDPDRNVARPTVNLQDTGAGDYYFILQVNDGSNYSEIDMVKIEVKEPHAWVDSTLTVDSILTDDIPPKHKFKTIQGAIDTMYDGTEKVIAIINGPYREKIMVKPHICLIGLRWEKASVPRLGSFVDDGKAVVTLDDYATINNLDIFVIKKREGEASKKSAIRVSGVEVKIKQCKIQNSYSDGITLENGSYAKVTDTLLAEVTGEGIVAEENSRLEVEGCMMLYTGGSSIWGLGADSIEIANSIIYSPGWDGLDLNCKNTTKIEHCTISNVGMHKCDLPRSGISIAGSGPVTVKSNIIAIRDNQDNTVLNGISIRGDHNPEDMELTHNYIYSYSKQEDKPYYDGNITIESVDLTNYPNRNIRTTDDPRIVDPGSGDFRLASNSPALGRGEKGTNPGASGDILKPCEPATPILSSPLPYEVVDPNNLIFKWEPSAGDPDGSSYSIKYSITINEDGDPEFPLYDDLAVYVGWENIAGASVAFKELKPLEKNLESGKRYWWCVQAVDKDGYKSNRGKGEWRCFITR